jgi:enterochelin esterase-like enzyme
VDELIPYVDANFRTLADQPHRGMAGLSMGGMETHSITLKHLDVFSHIGLFSGGVISPADVTNTPWFQGESQSRVLQLRQPREPRPASWSNHEALEAIGVKNTAYVSPDTAHEFLTWRRSLHEFAPLLFRSCNSAASRLLKLAVQLFSDKSKILDRFPSRSGWLSSAGGSRSPRRMRRA